MSFELSDLTYRQAAAVDVATLVAMLVDDQKGQGRDSTDPAQAGVYQQAFEVIEADPNNMI